MKLISWGAQESNVAQGFSEKESICKSDNLCIKSQSLSGPVSAEMCTKIKVLSCIPLNLNLSGEAKIKQRKPRSN